MTTRVFQRGLSVLAALGMLAAFLPSTAFAASVSKPTNVTVVGGNYTNDTTPTITWTRPTGATWYDVVLDHGDWQGIGNVGSYTLWNLSNGWHTFYVRAHDNAGNVSTSGYVTFEIDTQGPSVSTITPTSTVEDRATTFTVTPSGEAATSFCDLYVNGSNVGGMTKYGNSFRKTYTFNWSGTYPVYARCADGDGNYTSGPSRNVTVSSSENGYGDDDVNETFSVGTVSPSTATEDESATLRVSTSGTLDAATCLLYVNGASVGTMSEPSANSFTRAYTFSNDGSYTVYAICQDEDGDWERGASRTITVYEHDEDDYEDDDNNDAPTVPAVSPSSAIEDEEVTITVNPSSDERVSWCDLYVNGSNVGDMDRQSNGTFELEYTFTNDGSYTVYATCTDVSYDTTRGSSRTIRVYEEGDNDDDSDSNNGDLSVPRVSPSTAEEDERTEFTVKPSGDYNITQCWLYVDGSFVAEMDEESTNVFRADYTFRNDGDYSVYAYCKDSHGNTELGEKRTVRVNDEDYDYGSDDDDSDNDAEEGSLIKMRCSGSVSVNDPCKAVYYYGEDGKRHVFPNEATYFTWYRDFDDVEEVSSSFMSSLTIGKNVTFRPGSVLVKFASASSIYAVEKDHTLRRYTKTSLIESDYGDDYEDVLVTISDSLYNNYTIGSVIDSTGDYDRDDEYYSVDSIDDVL